MKRLKCDSLSKWLDLQDQCLSSVQLLSKLCDPGSIFLPIRMNMTREGEDFRLVSGLIDIMRRPVLVLFFNQKIQGGVFTPQMVKQILRVLDVAIANKQPVLFWGGSAGADLTEQDKLFVETGGIYHRLAQLEKLGVPTISVVRHVATAGGAYIPGLCQVVIAIEGAEIYLAGPPLVQAAIGQRVSGDQLGGARMHLEKTGLVTHVAEDEQGAIDMVLGYFRQQNEKVSGSYSHITQRLDSRFWWREQQFQVKKFIQDLVYSGLNYFQDDEGGIICAFAKIQSIQWAIIASNGPITAFGARKGAEFLIEAENRKLPVLFIQNTVGFMVGVEQEQNGAIVHGSALLAAVSALSSVKVTLHVGPSFGAGYYALCAQSFDPDFILSWPMYELAVMSGRNAAKVISMIKKKKKAISCEEEQHLFAKLEAQYAQQSSASYNSYQGRDDCMIDPEDTLIALCRVAQLCGLYDN